MYVICPLYVLCRLDSQMSCSETILPAESFIVEDAAALFEKEYDAGRVIALADSKALIDNWLNVGMIIE